MMRVAVARYSLNSVAHRAGEQIRLNPSLFHEQVHISGPTRALTSASRASGVVPGWRRSARWCAGCWISVSGRFRLNLPTMAAAATEL